MSRMGTLWVVVTVVSACGCSQPSEELIRTIMAYNQRMEPPLLAAAPDAAAEVAPEPITDVGAPLWLQAGLALAEEADETGTQEAFVVLPKKPPFVPWPKRRGPAYPGDFWRSFGRDAKEMPLTLWDDVEAAATNPLSLICLGLAGAGGITLSGRPNDRVEEHYEHHGSGLNTFWDTVGDAGGNPGTHFAVAGAMYFGGLAAGDTKTYEVSKTLLNALSINGVATLLLKVAARTESPNGDENGWPSGHTSSSFCFATVMYHEYGPWVGVPLLGFAAFVGYERIDARNHDFSDVISGALIGIAIGHAVAKNHDLKVFGMDVVPVVSGTTGTTGVGLSKQW